MTGASSSRDLEAQAEEQRLRARPRVEARRRRRGRVCACAIAWPSSAGLGARRARPRASRQRACRRRARSRSRPGRSRACPARPRPMRQRGGIEKSPASACRRPSSSANRRRLAGAVAADQADFLARVEGDAGAVEHDLGAAAKETLLRTIMRDFRRRPISARASAPRGCRLRRRGLALDQQRPGRRRRWSRARRASRRGKAASKCARSWPISSTSTASSLMCAGASRERCARTRSMPSAPPASASAGSARYSAGSARHARGVDVRRVAQDQVVAGRAAPRAGRTATQRDALAEPCRSTLMRATASASAETSAASTSTSG